MNLADIAKSLVGELRSLTETHSVIGTPIEIGDVKIIPISKVSVGFGTGQNDGRSGGASGGLGGAVAMQPLGFLVVKSDGQAELLSLAGSKGGMLAKALEAVPETVERIARVRAPAGEGKLSSGQSGSSSEG